jgi:hypothetical protein
MRRAQAIFVIILLLSTPLSLLARSASGEMPPCGGMCCLPHHGQHSAGAQPASQNQQHQGESCEHSAPGQMPNCAMNCGGTSADHGYLSPIAPTRPSNLASVARLNVLKAAKFQSAMENVAAGFLSTLFQPPRS